MIGLMKGTNMNNIDCPCKRTKCERHGNCAACREHHHDKNSKKPLTRCEKLKKKEEKREDREKRRQRKKENKMERG